jgi:hypothetical protein
MKLQIFVLTYACNFEEPFGFATSNDLKVELGVENRPRGESVPHLLISFRTREAEKY